MSATKIEVYRGSDGHALTPEQADGSHLHIELPVMSGYATEVYLDCLEVLNRVFLGALPQAADDSEETTSGLGAPRTLNPRTLFREAAMLAEARQLILQDGDWVTAAGLSQLTGLEPAALAAGLRAWLRDGRLISVSDRRQEYFPVFAFGDATERRPTAEFGAVIKVLSKKRTAGAWRSGSPRATTCWAATARKTCCDRHRSACAARRKKRWRGNWMASPEVAWEVSRCVMVAWEPHLAAASCLHWRKQEGGGARG